MPKNQTEPKPPSVEEPREEGLSSSVLLADLIEHWERRCVALDKLVDDAKKTASEETIARLQGKASMARSMTVELKREIRSDGVRSDLCTFHILGEICGNCACPRKSLANAERTHGANQA